MMELESMIRAQRIMCLKKYIDDYTSAWKSFLSYYLEKVGGNFILQCHFDCRNLPHIYAWVLQRLPGCLVLSHKAGSVFL